MGPTLAILGLFYSRKVHFFVHLFNNLNYEVSKHSNLRSASKTKTKNKTRPEPRNHTKDPPLVPLFIGTMGLFSIFLFQQKLHLQFLTIPPLPILSFSGTFFVFLPEACQVKSVEFSLLLIVTDYFSDCYDYSMTALVFLVYYYVLKTT